MADEFDDRRSELLNIDDWSGFLGIKHSARFHTKAGVSNLYSEVGFLEDVSNADLAEVPDYVLSDTLQKSLNSAAMICAVNLKKTKYLPDDAKIGTRYGLVTDGQNEGLYIENWKDLSITGANGEPVYTWDQISSAVDAGETELGAAMSLIVKDICDADGFLTEEWYFARILYEYVRTHPIPPDNAFLIGALFKEVSVKQQYEGDLSSYYLSLVEAQSRRKAGAESTKSKAEELREYCVDLFVDLVVQKGPRLMLAPPEYQADELRKVALTKRPDDFLRGGKAYRKEWFLRNIIEDRRIDIVQALENNSRK